MADTDSFPVNEVNRVRRKHDRGRFDKRTVYDILDAAMVCHIAYSIDGQPYCTPTSFWREGDHLYWHGSSASRMLRAQGQGIPVCLAVTHVDSIVLARCGFNHSINYRSVMAYGQAHVIEDPQAKLRLMDSFVDRFFPGRAATLRPPTPGEFKATTMVGMEIERASGKVRDMGVHDDEADYAVPAWTALIPVRTVLGEPVECERQLPGVGKPEGMRPYQDGASFDAVMRETYQATFGD